MWTDRLRCPSAPETISSNTHPSTQMLQVLSIPIRTMSSHVEFRQKMSLRFICNLDFLGIQLLRQSRKTYTLFASLEMAQRIRHSQHSTAHWRCQRCYSRLVSHPSRPPSFHPPPWEAGHSTNSYSCISEQYVWDKGVFQKQLP